MYRLILAAVLLTGCVAKIPTVPQGAFRATGQQMYSSAVLDRARLPGKWQQVAAFGPAQPGCKPGGVDIAGKTTLTAVFRLCLNGQDVRGSGPLQPVGPGRFAVAGQEWWVVWADGDYRTLAIGTPSGAYGFVLNRGGAISGDRMRAAAEILEWNGYDMGRFHAF